MFFVLFFGQQRFRNVFHMEKKKKDFVLFVSKYVVKKTPVFFCSVSPENFFFKAKASYATKNNNYESALNRVANDQWQRKALLRFECLTSEMTAPSFINSNPVNCCSKKDLILVSYNELKMKSH